MQVRIVAIGVTALVLGVAGTASAGTTGKASAGKADTSSTGTPSAATWNTQSRFTVTNLVSDVKGRAAVTDPALVNPWGLAMGKTLWVSAAGTGLATVYSGGAGTVKQEKTQVRVPGGRPTGQVVNSGDEFVVKGPGGSGPATFIFASPSGAITGWNAEADPDDAIISAFVKGADLKGLALAQTNRGPMLLAADFANNRVHVFDGDFDRLQMGRNAFRDPGMPADYAPFNVEVVGRSILVAYAKRDPQTGKAVAGKGKGFISHFDGSGRFVDRFAARGALNAPWAMTLAPKGFGAQSGALLVGNFGDGWINAYNPRNGRSLGPLRSADGKPIVLGGLWDLERGTATVGGENALWFSAGSDGGTHGVLGVIRPAGASTSAPAASPSATPAPSASHPGSHSNSNSNSGSGY
ncbi:TIGR03118 family protein [Streptosporangium subroseum]|uniref:TIGR03118 family protein n=1 Tax=Streptosporangium subroseum TaxID=106412 RepID=A0A239GMG4_9ACTN|nr:TIGR03118 family protein [Streptosporangium subroseum]SNS70075.1 TIGR03118 family protein [Streptosporangium subroseum]